MNDITAQAILAAAAAEDAAQSASQAVQPNDTGAPVHAAPVAPVATLEGQAVAPGALMPTPMPAPEPMPARPSGAARRRKAQDDEAADADRAQADESAADSADAASVAASGAAAGDWGSLPTASDLLAQAAVPSDAAVAPTSAGTDAPDSAPSGSSLVEVLLGAVPMALLAAAAGSDSAPAPAPTAPDTTPPRVSIDAPARSVSATPTVTGTTDLADGATVSIRLQRADGSTADYTVKVQGGQFSLPIPTALPEGSYTVTVTAVDAAGNRATASDTGTVDLMTIDGTITAGPVVSGHGLTVTAYAADGSALGSSPVAADGSYRIVLQQPYAGLMLVRVSDANAAADYRDEASGQAQDLTVDLRAVAQADGSQDLVVNVTPATELVVLGLGLAAGDSGNAAAQLGQVSTAQVSAAQGAVQSALGLPDGFVSATVVPTVRTDGSVNPQANVYGQVLAAISGLSVTQGQQVGSVLAGLQPEVADGSIGRAAAVNLVGAAVVANASGTAVGNALGFGSADATAITSAWSAVVGATRTDGVAPTAADLAVLGVASAGTTQALALVVSAIQGSSASSVGSVAALSTLSVAANNVVEASQGSGELTVKDLQTLGVEGVTADNLDTVAQALASLGVDNLPASVEALTSVVQTVVQDTTPPTLSMTATLGTDAGATPTVASGGLTRDSTVVVSGMVSDAGGVAYVRVYDGSVLLGNASVAADGSWSLTTPALSNGAHSISAQAADLAGNVVTSTALAFTVDAAGPVFSSASTASAPEKAAFVYQASASDANAPAGGFVWQLSGPDAALLQIDSQGAVSLKSGVLDRGQRTSYEFTVSTSDSAGNVSSRAVTVSVTNVNDAPTGLPTISGTATEDQVLTASTSGIADVDGLGSMSVQWLRNGTAIAGATGATYTLGDADVGQQISVRVTYTDGQGTVETLTSAPTAPVANVNDAPTGLPTISGTATEDQVLTVSTSGIADADGLGAMSVQWLRNGTAIDGATSTTYTLGDADVGQQISVRVTYTDGQGTVETLTSAPTAAVANVNDAPTGQPTISGTATEDQVLTVSTSGIADVDGLGSMSVQWLRNGTAIAGANGATYTLGDADVGQQISVRVTYTDGQGTVETLTSAPTAAISGVNDAPTGLPTISGTATEDQVLTVSTTGIADVDGLGTMSVQWLRDGTAIDGATSTTYTLSDADVGQQISARVSYTDGQGTVETLTSAPTAAITGVNDVPTGLPTISGTATEDQVLTVSTSGIADADGLGSMSVQWLRNGTAIAGATGATYALGDADVGQQISARVTYTDGQGTVETLTSAPTAAVVNVNDLPTGLPTISGTVSSGRVLSVSTSGIGDADGLGTMSVQWLRGGTAIDGATGTTYTLDDTDVGQQISVRVTYTDGEGTVETLTSAQTAEVAPSNYSPTGLPVISGTATEDQVLTVDTSGIADADGLGTMSVQWLRDGTAISGATSVNYTLTDADVGRQVSVRVSYTDGQGAAETLTSAPTAAVSNVNDAPTGQPTISGTATEDQVLTVSTSGIADADGLGSMSVQWLRGGTAIAGATGTTYTLGDADVGQQISARVSYTDGQGTVETLTSAPTAAITGVNDAPTGLPTISGTATEDQVLTVSTSGIADVDGLGTMSVQWLRGGTAIAGATGTTYTLGDADVGQQISVRVTYTDGQGTTETLTSAPTAAVANVNDLPTGLPTITGTVTEDQVLTVDTSGIADADGLGTGAMAVQWLRNGTAISGANGTTYTLGDVDVGQRISVQVSYTDARGAAETVTSDQTAAVANFLDPVISGAAFGARNYVNASTLINGESVTGGITGNLGYDYVTGQTVRVTVGGQAFTGVVNDLGTFSVRVNNSAVFAAADGVSSFPVLVELLDGATVTASQSVTVQVDTGYPSASMPTTLTTDYGALAAGGTTRDRTVSFSIDASDAGSGIGSVLVLDNGTLIGNATLVPGGGYSFTTPELAEGAHSLALLVTDVAGNVTATFGTPFTFTVDVTGPEVTSAQNAQVRENQELVYQATGVGVVNWSIGSGGDDDMFSVDSTGRVTRTGGLDFEARSTYTFNLVAADAAGNTTTHAVNLTVLDVPEFQIQSVTVGGSDNVLSLADVTLVNDEEVVGVAITLSGDYVSTAEDAFTIVGYQYTVRAQNGGEYSATGMPTEGRFVVYVPLTELELYSHVTVTVTATIQDALTGEESTFDVTSAAVNHTYQVDTAPPTLAVTTFQDSDNVSLLAADGITIYRNAITLGGTVSGGGSGGTGPTLQVYDNNVLLASPAVDPATGAWSYSASGLAEGSHTVRIVYTDWAGNATEMVRQFTYAVDSVAPSITTPTDLSVDENTTLSVALAATDVSPLTWSIVGGTDAGLFNISGGNRLVLASGMPDFEAKSTYNVTVRATDSSGNHSDKAIAIRVNNVDEPSVITGNTTATLQEDVGVNGSGQLVANGVLVVNDPDGDANNGIDTSFSFNGTYGTFTITEAGAWTYVASNSQSAIQALSGPGTTLTDAFEVTSIDGTKATVTITITGTDDAPVIGSAVATFTEGGATTVSGTLTATDVDSPAPTFIENDYEGDFSTIHVNADGTWTATFQATAENLPSGEVRQHDIGVMLSDGSEATLTLRWVGVDDAPVISTGTGSITEDAAPSTGGRLFTTGTLTFSDPDGPAQTFVATTYNGSYGSLVIDAAGAWTYTLDTRADALAAGASASDNFTVALSGGASTSVNISLTGADDTPVISGATGAVTEDTSPTVSGTLAIADPDSAATVVPATVSGTYGSLTIDAAGAWTYTLDSRANPLAGGATATDTVGISLSDGSTSSIAITVTGTNDAPSTTTSAGSIAVVEDTATTITLANLITLLGATDADGSVSAVHLSGSMGTFGTLRIGTDSASATSYNAATNFTIDATRNAYFTPGSNRTGTYSLLSASFVDNSGASSSQANLSVAISPVNDAPQLVATVVSGNSINVHDGSASVSLFSVINDVTDPDSTQLSFVTVSCYQGWDFTHDSLSLVNDFVFDESLFDVAVSGNSLTVTPRSGASPSFADWESLLSTVTFTSDSGALTGQRYFQVLLSDGQTSRTVTNVFAVGGGTSLIGVNVEDTAAAAAEPAANGAAAPAMPAEEAASAGPALPALDSDYAMYPEHYHYWPTPDSPFLTL